MTGSAGRSIVKFTYNGNGGSGGGNSSQFQYIGTGSRSIYKGRDYGFQPPSAGDYEFTMTYNASSSWQIANTTRSNPVTLKNLQALSGTTQFYRVYVPGSGTCTINIQKVPEVTYIREGSSTVIKDRNYGFQPASAGDYEFQMTYNASSSWQIANTNRTNPAVLKGLNKLTGTTSYYRIYVPGSGSCTVRITKIPEVTYIREGSSTVIKDRNYGFQPTVAGDYEFTMTYNASSSWQIANANRTNPAVLKGLNALAGTTSYYRIYVPGSGNCTVKIERQKVQYIGLGVSSVTKGREYGFKSEVPGVYRFQMTYNPGTTWEVAGYSRTNPVNIRLTQSTGSNYWRIYVPGAGICNVSIDLLVEEETTQMVYWTKRYSFTPSQNTNYTFTTTDGATLSLNGQAAKVCPVTYTLQANVKYTLVFSGYGRALSSSGTNVTVRRSGSSGGDGATAIVNTYKLNSPYTAGKVDAQRYYDRIKGDAKNVTYSGTCNLYYDVTSSDFTNKASTIKYWGSHGTQKGNVYGDDSNAKYTMTDSVKFSGGKLEFLLISACYQLGDNTSGTDDYGNPLNGYNMRAKYAKAMLDTTDDDVAQGVRVIAGYQRSAPRQFDYDVAYKFTDYIKATDSVKSAWIKANYDVGGSARRNFIVLTHQNDSSFTRLPGFVGSKTYARPGYESKKIWRFSNVNCINSNGSLVIPDEGNNENYFSESGLVFKQELSELLSTDIPQYSLKAKVHTLNVKDDVKNISVFREDSKLTTSLSEIGHIPITMTENDLLDKSRNWVETSLEGLSSSDLGEATIEIDAIAMADVDLDGRSANEKEEIVAYSIDYQNTYEGIPIDGDFHTVILDQTNIAYSSTNWHTMERVARDDRDLSNVRFVSLDEAIKSIVQETQKMESVQENTLQNETNVVENVELRFALDPITGLYEPTWVFEMASDSVYHVNCGDGNLYVVK